MMLEEITNNLPRQFLLDALENTDAAFIGAKHMVDEVIKCEEPERLQMLGHHRHWGQEQGMRQAARSSNLKTLTPHTTPRGGRYSLVQAGNLILARTKITTAGSSLRPAKYMRSLASHNRHLEPYQLDMFLEEFDLPDDYIFGLIITVAPKPWQIEARPSYVGIGIPTSDLKSWHFRDSLENLLAGYSNTELEIIPDRAVPKLKKLHDKKLDGSGLPA